MLRIPTAGLFGIKCSAPFSWWSFAIACLRRPAAFSFNLRNKSGLCQKKNLELLLQSLQRVFWAFLLLSYFFMHRSYLFRPHVMTQTAIEMDSALRLTVTIHFLHLKQDEHESHSCAMLRNKWDICCALVTERSCLYCVSFAQVCVMLNALCVLRFSWTRLDGGNGRWIRCDSLAIIFFFPPLI